MFLLFILLLSTALGCIIDDNTVFSFSPNFTHTPLIGDENAISEIRHASAELIVFRSKFQTDVLKSNDVFIRILQLVEPFNYPLYKESAVLHFLEGKTVKEVNEILFGLKMVVEGMRKTACNDNERLNLVDGDGDFECESTVENTHSSIYENSLFFVVVGLSYIILSFVIVKLRVDNYRLKNKKRD